MRPQVQCTGMILSAEGLHIGHSGRRCGIECDVCGKYFTEQPWRGCCAECWPIKERAIRNWAETNPAEAENWEPDFTTNVVRGMVSKSNTLSERQATWTLLTARDLAERGSMTAEELAEVEVVTNARLRELRRR